MKMLEQPLCPLSHLRRHLQRMTQATCRRAAILEYRFLPVPTLQLIPQQKCLIAQVGN